MWAKINNIVQKSFYTNVWLVPWELCGNSQNKNDAIYKYQFQYAMNS